MATRKEEKERRRAERLEAERRESEAARKRVLLGYGVAGLLTAAVIAGIVVVIAGSGGGAGSSDTPAAAHINVETGSVNGVPADAREGTPPPLVRQASLSKAAAAAHCDLRLNLPNEGQTHIAPGKHVTYDTNPPTSGNHVAPPYQQADGAYSKTPVDINYVHSLEHGRIEIQYSLRLPEEDQLALKGVFDDSPSGMLLFPNSKMPYEVATTAWTQLMGCKKYEGSKTLDAIRDFRDQYRGRGPEQVFPITP
jgi:hypothetical protein